MTAFEFDLVFALPEPASEPVQDGFSLADAIYAAGFDDAVVGIGRPGLVAVALDLDGEDAETVIRNAAAKILTALPAGAQLREVRPDLVSLADVAAHLEVKRQALQKRPMPPPLAGGLYRATEVQRHLAAPMKRKARVNLDRAAGWFAAAHAAQRINAFLALGQIDPVSLERTG